VDKAATKAIDFANYLQYAFYYHHAISSDVAHAPDQIWRWPYHQSQDDGDLHPFAVLDLCSTGHTDQSTVFRVTQG